MDGLTYTEFLNSKAQLEGDHGFAPIDLPEWMFDFQQSLVEWALRKGRAAIFADCGLGKTPMQLVWADNVARHTNKPVLILTPLAVGPQTVREAEKFGIEAVHCRDGQYGNAQIVVTNYERLHYFDSKVYETYLLGARDGSIVIKTFHESYDVKNDGRLRSDAREPKYPGVVIAFDVPSLEGAAWVPMAFECDQFTTWKANVQAIAGALEALRKIERYGVSSRGKSNAHYEGYKALPSAEGKVASRESAAAFMAQHSGVNREEIMFSDTARAAAYRKAAQKLHPDGGGTTEEFQKLVEANLVLKDGAV